MTVRMFKLQSLADAYCLSKLQETNNIVARKINKPLVSTTKPVNNSYVRNFGTQAQNIHYNLPRPKPVYNNAPYKKQLTQKELDDKRAKNQWFYCDQKYVPGHKCSGKLFSLEIVEENRGSEEEMGEQFEEGMFGFEDNSTENMIADQNVCNSKNESPTQPQISLNAISRVNTFQTMRVKGQINNKPVNILIDCGSTHNFLDLTTTKQIGCPVKESYPLQVAVPGANFLTSTHVSTGLTWKLQGVTFQADFMLIPLGKNVALRGVPQPAMGAKLFSMAVCVYPSHGIKAKLMSTGINSELTNIHPLLSPLMHKYDGVFAIPKSLPPHRKHDHRIPLQENTSPINIRPYRHPPIQKDAIEAMVTELLESGVIRESHSPFSTPIVMVKKKDGTWRMCVDYRALNKKTMKDKFPIPIIEELIDEFFRAKVFTKLDLRFGYHQIRMCEEDIHKTAFSTHQGVSTDPSKVQAMQDWPVPVNIKKLRGFLGLTRYYRRFIKNYAAISRPLTDLLKKNSFEWSNTAQQAFEELKIAMMNALVLALPNFQEEFIVETDASEEGIGAVLQQQGHPIAFLSRTLAPRHKGLSTYEKEFWAVVYALEKWRGYLLDRHFKIKTDHFSLKYLIEQRLTTPFQIKWLPKLLGYDYEILYKKGSENVVADVLSRSPIPSLQTMVVSDISNDLLERIKAMRRNGKLVIGSDENLRQELLKFYHDEPMGGHSGIEASYKRLKAIFYWKGMKRLSKYGHFIPLSRPFKAAQIAQVFLDSVYKLHGLPKTITSDRDKIFISTFWKELFKRLGITLQLSIAYHPQTDSQTEVVNRCLESINTTPFEVVYGQKPPTHISYMAGDSHMEVVDRQVTLRMHKQHKFSPKFYGPFQIEAKCGEVAYKLTDAATIHNVFHVSQLKLFRGQPTIPIPIPHCNKEGLITAVPVAVLDRRIAKVNNVVVVYWLIQWSNGNVDDATCEVATNLQARYHAFDPNP
ncbi:transposon ty3-I gag-pol polyprotein [Tanacetum coccineum]|uniref:Transposon ty3-I gag-pol polyprotein n=1 Tax=Tanacetum coccineum TaxID=301880 RepID=A0ABQ5IGT7_9ASTR